VGEKKSQLNEKSSISAVEPIVSAIEFFRQAKEHGTLYALWR
jgi:hypothetical protein